jgi:hypothetical protein
MTTGRATSFRAALGVAAPSDGGFWPLTGSLFPCPAPVPPP